MPEFPRSADLSLRGAPFLTLKGAQSWARWRAERTGERQTISLRVTGPARHRRWIVRPVVCECWPTPASMHYVYYGAIEPGSAWEWNPDCRAHPR